MIDFDALERANAPLNAFVEWDRSATVGTGPLGGLTIGVKANIMVGGLAWTSGMALHRERIAARDAEVVAQLRSAGAAVIGTLNLEEAALGAATRNPWYGWTRNPHAPDHTPGGSSGGSAAAVAAGLCDAALGTDTLGSIRIPAAYCGVYGFKPANAAVSSDGLDPAEASFDVIGPLARSIVLVERVARVISRFGEGQVAGSPAILADGGGVTCEPAVSAAFARARNISGVAAEVSLDHPLSRIRFAGFVKTAKALAAHLEGADATLLSPTLHGLLGYGARRSDADWTDDQAVLAATKASIRRAVDRYGSLLMPTAPQVAFPDTASAPADQADFTCLANIAGLPALSIPAGSHDGLPIGVQIVGAEGAEAGLFALARRLDHELAAYRPPPPTSGD